MLSVLSWRGRMSGRDYFTAQFAILLAALLIDQLPVRQQPAVNVLIVAGGVVVVHFFCVTTIRRFHDMGRSGWNLLWVCLYLSIINSITSPFAMHFDVSFVLLSIGVAWIVQRPSARAANEWGPPLLVPDDAIARVADSPFGYVVLALPAIFRGVVLTLASLAP